MNILTKIFTKTIISFLSFAFIIKFMLVMVIMAVYRAIQLLYSYITQGEKISINPLQYAHPDVFKNPIDMIQWEGFQIKQYKFTTEDNYTVVLWRLVNKQRKICFKYPIIIQHGLLDCSISWFLHQNKQRLNVILRKNSLPYKLCLQGFDVWVSNNRGTKFSLDQQHRQDYWNYSIDQLAKYDVPTIINGILKESKTQKVIYIGHSQGTTQFLCSFLQNQYLKQKIVTFIGLGPVISIRNINNHLIIKLLSNFSLLEICKWIGFKKVLHLSSWMNICIGILAYNLQIYLKAGYHLINVLCGYPEGNNIDNNNFGVILSHVPGGASVNNVLHWIQLSRVKQFQKFDFGKVQNLKKYGQEVPPIYNFTQLKKLKFNKYLFRGMKDSLISDQDYKFLLNKLDNNTKSYQIQDYAHIDYVWGQKAHHKLYDQILNICIYESG